MGGGGEKLTRENIEGVLARTFRGYLRRFSAHIRFEILPRSL